MSVSRPWIGVAFAALLTLSMLANAMGVVSERLLDLVFVVFAGLIVFKLSLRILVSRALAGTTGLSAVMVLVGIQFVWPSIRYAPYLMIVFGNVGMAYIFVRDLWVGRPAVLLQLIDLIGRRPIDDPNFRRFITHQCVLWSLLSAATATFAVVAIVGASIRTQMDAALFLVISAQVAWFVLSHHYAQLRYRRPETWWTTLRTMVRRDVLVKLRIL